MSKPQPKDHLPRTVDPRKLAQQGITLEGNLWLNQAKRLHAAVIGDDEAEISTTLHFGRDVEGYYTVTGSAVAPVSVTCQRCLKPISLELRAEVSLAVVKTEEESINLPSHLEPLILNEEKIEIAELLDEELLLELPFVSYHPSGQCHMEYEAKNDAEGNDVETKKENPFAVLGQLKGKLPG